MELILLAAGLGRRFADGDDRPKVLLPLPSGRSLLAENLRNAAASGVVTRTTVVTGHRADLVAREVGRVSRDGSVTAIHNPDYATHGPILSLWAARDHIRAGDVMIGNGDTYFRPEAFRTVGAADGPPTSLGCTRRDGRPDDVRVVLHANGTLARVGKRLPTDAATHASAGLLALRGEAVRERFAALLADFVSHEDEPGRRAIWHDLVNELATAGEAVRAVELAEDWWREVDTPDDHEGLRTLLMDR